MERHLHRIIPILLHGALLTACGGPAAPIHDSVVRVSLEDTLFRRIHSLAYEQEPDSLLPYLSDPNATYRYLAASVLGSFQEEIPIDSLATLLDDPVDEVRAAAAFAMGQSTLPEAEPYLLRAFEQFDTLNQFQLSNRAILEAVGKCGDSTSLKALATIRTYTPTDTALLEGQAWGLYRFALRGMNTTEGTRRMVELVTRSEYPASVRVIAANYLYRSQKLDMDESAHYELARTLLGDEDPRIRMALAIGLGKTGSPLALEALENAYKLDPDYRVKCNVLSALGNFDYDEVSDLAFEALRDSNIMVAERAGSFFLANGNAADAFNYYSVARRGLPWQVDNSLYAAVLRHLPSRYKDVRSSATNRLRQKISDENASPFDQIAALRALAEDPWNYQYIYEGGFDAGHSLVRQAAVEALAAIHADPGASSETFTRFLAPYFREAVTSGDPAMVGPAALALTDRSRDYEDYLNDLDFLDEAFRENDAARTPEVKRILAQALDSLKGGNRAASLSIPRRGIGWNLLDSLGDHPRISMRADEGEIILELFTDKAPGTVSSFLQLISDGFYRNTYFYRVVPNFVIQGAQPLDIRPETFVISSEFSEQHYLQEGYLGMASSGPNTESTHFFITHSPTPHLDGRYTLFGKVVEGMDVVHRITRGSRINSTAIVLPEVQ